MALASGRHTRSSVRAIVPATAYSVAVLALMVCAAVNMPSPAMAQVKPPPKAKLKPRVTTNPTDGAADRLNAKWLRENGTPGGPPKTESDVVPASLTTPSTATNWGDRLVSRAMQYLGTPYRYGGTSPSTGFDCSGFVYYLYGAVFGQRIPRMPHDMARQGTPVARGELKRGDLVFFGYRGTFTHMGVYAGNGQFVHATHSGSPVMVTPLDSAYYRERYMAAVRLSPQ